MSGATGPFNVVTRWPATSRNITFQHWRGPAAQLLLSIVCRSGVFLISFDGCWRPWIVNLDCPAQTRQTNCVRSRGAPRQPPRTQPRSPHHDRSVGPWGGAERRNTKDEHAMLPDYIAIMPLAAVGPAKFSLRLAHWLRTRWRQAVVISTVRCQLRVPSPTPRLLAAKRVCIDGAKAWSSQMYRGEPT